ALAVTIAVVAMVALCAADARVAWIENLHALRQHRLLAPATVALASSVAAGALARRWFARRAPEVRGGGVLVAAAAVALAAAAIATHDLPGATQRYLAPGLASIAVVAPALVVLAVRRACAALAAYLT